MGTSPAPSHLARPCPLSYPLLSRPAKCRPVCLVSVLCLSCVCLVVCSVVSYVVSLVVSPVFSPVVSLVPCLSVLRLSARLPLSHAKYPAPRAPQRRLGRPSVRRARRRSRLASGATAEAGAGRPAPLRGADGMRWRRCERSQAQRPTLMLASWGLRRPYTCRMSSLVGANQVTACRT